MGHELVVREFAGTDVSRIDRDTSRAFMAAATNRCSSVCSSMAVATDEEKLLGEVCESTRSYTPPVSSV